MEGPPVPRASEPAYRSGRAGTALKGRVFRVPWFYLYQIRLSCEIPSKGTVITHTPGYFWARRRLRLLFQKPPLSLQAITRLCCQNIPDAAGSRSFSSSGGPSAPAGTSVCSLLERSSSPRWFCSTSTSAHGWRGNCLGHGWKGLCVAGEWPFGYSLMATN